MNHKQVCSFHDSEATFICEECVSKEPECYNGQWPPVETVLCRYQQFLLCDECTERGPHSDHAFK